MYLGEHGEHSNDVCTDFAERSCPYQQLHDTDRAEEASAKYSLKKTATRNPRRCWNMQSVEASYASCEAKWTYLVAIVVA